MYRIIYYKHTPTHSDMLCVRYAVLWSSLTTKKIQLTLMLSIILSLYCSNIITVQSWVCAVCCENFVLRFKSFKKESSWCCALKVILAPSGCDTPHRIGAKKRSIFLFLCISAFVLMHTKKHVMLQRDWKSNASALCVDTSTAHHHHQSVSGNCIRWMRFRAAADKRCISEMVSKGSSRYEPIEGECFES